MLIPLTAASGLAIVLGVPEAAHLHGSLAIPTAVLALGHAVRHLRRAIRRARARLGRWVCG